MNGPLRAHFFQRGSGLRQTLIRTAAAQRDHGRASIAFFFSFERRKHLPGTSFLDLVIHFHHFRTNRSGPLYPVFVADPAAFAFFDLHCLGFFRGVAFFDEAPVPAYIDHFRAIHHICGRTNLCAQNQVNGSPRPERAQYPCSSSG